MADRSPTRTTTSAPWWRARWVLPLALLVLALVFVLENRDPVTIRLLVPAVVIPQWAAPTITLIIGILVGATARRRRRR